MTLRSSLMNVSAIGVAALAQLAAMPAKAHIDMFGVITGRGGDEKQFPCDGSRTSGTEFTFEPGSTITLGVSENIPHPSYFRIAFDDAGEDNFVEPKSIKPIDKNRPCPYDENDQCGEPDFCNVRSTTGGPTVLWDNLDPHLAEESKGNYTWTIKLPNVECENCTLQVIQVMEDTVHQAYCPHGSCADCSFLNFACDIGGLQDIYHRCVNIKLKRGAGATTGATSGPAQNNGIDCLARQMTDGGVGPADASVPQDATSGSDAGASGATSGGTAGSTGGGASPGGSSTGGTTGVIGGMAGVGGGAVGGTGTAGGISGTTGGGTGIAGGGAATAGTAVAGAAGGIASGTTAGTMTPSDDGPNDDGCDCAVSDGSPRYGNLISMGLLALGLLARRRRKSQ